MTGDRPIRLGLALFLALVGGLFSIGVASAAGGKVKLEADLGREMVRYPGGRELFSQVFSGRTLLTRLYADGRRDRSFGRHGSLLLRFVVTGVAVGSDGKISLLGSERGPRSSWQVVRLLPSGKRDRTFGEEGAEAISLGYARETLDSIAVTADQETVVGGEVTDNLDERGAPPDGVVVRLGRDGALDQGFAAAGVLTLTWTQGVPVPVQQLKPLPGGAILASDGGIEIRITRDGSVDPRFGEDGRVELRPTKQVLGTRFFGSNMQTGFSSDGSSFAVGGLSTPQGSGGREEYDRQLLVLKYAADGRPDRSYGSRGVARVAFRRTVYPQAMAVGAGGRVIVVGTSFRPTNPPHFVTEVVLCLDPSGRLDPRFGHGGRMHFLYPSNSRLAVAQFMSRGRILLYAPFGLTASYLQQVRLRPASRLR